MRALNRTERKVAVSNSTKASGPREIRKISSKDCWPLRLKLLRPGQSIETVQFEGDDWPGSLHLGAFMRLQGDETPCVGVLSLIARNELFEKSSKEFQLRGMAVEPSLQGQGVGAELLAEGIRWAKETGIHMIWCNARTPVLNFYRKFGFASEGEEFDIPLGGPHYRMRWGRETKVPD
ncbi:MAG: GNAT family N-acetyltransferase [Bradymonadales bacterium]|nr:MAG: GNAT family N-acetyltransferase [Bradymonadales bacterium]